MPPEVDNSVDAVVARIATRREEEQAMINRRRATERKVEHTLTLTSRIGAALFFFALAAALLVQVWAWVLA